MKLLEKTQFNYQIFIVLIIASGEWIINGKLMDNCEKQRGGETTKVEKVAKEPSANR